MEFTLILRETEVKELENQRVNILSKENVDGLIYTRLEVATNFDLLKITRAFWHMGMMRGSEVMGQTMELLLNK